MQFTTTFILLSLLWLKANYGLLTINVKEKRANTSSVRGTHQDVAKRIIDEADYTAQCLCQSAFVSVVGHLETCDGRAHIW
ncbi:hypothetical protein AHF37_07645 [Paragonimus kellicotti]|nr:hypothetical protein AHF37_07645 [Paragonimus kellicotti]